MPDSIDDMGSLRVFEEGGFQCCLAELLFWQQQGWVVHGATWCLGGSREEAY